MTKQQAKKPEARIVIYSEEDTKLREIVDFAADMADAARSLPKARMFVVEYYGLVFVFAKGIAQAKQALKDEATNDWDMPSYEIRKLVAELGEVEA